MEFLRGWIFNIVATIIFVIIVEIILPSGSTRKYIGLVTGLMVMFVIINPFVNLISGEYDLDVRVQQVSRAIALRDVQNQVESFEKGNREGIVMLYKNNLEQQIKSQLVERGLAKEVWVQVEIDENYGSEEFGRLIGIRAVIADAADGEDESIKKVDKVTVRVSEAGKDGQVIETVSANSVQTTEIVHFLADTYELPAEGVEVTLQGLE